MIEVFTDSMGLWHNGWNTWLVISLSSGPGQVVGALYLSDCTGMILNHKVTCSRRYKERGKINPSSAICETNMEIRAMYGKKVGRGWKETCGDLVMTVDLRLPTITGDLMWNGFGDLEALQLREGS